MNFIKVTYALTSPSMPPLQYCGVTLSFCLVRKKLMEIFSISIGIIADVTHSKEMNCIKKNII
jgi:hypothetical protein